MALPLIPAVMEWGWEEEAASTETMMRMREEERNCFENQGSKTFAKTARLGALRCLALLMKGMTNSESFWFKAVVLLDRYSSYCANLPKLPLTCATIARIMAKLNVGGLCDQNFLLTQTSAGRLQVAKDFAIWVGTTFDCATEEITNSTLKEHELEVLKALDWKVDCPCLEQWLLMISVRFNGLTGGRNTVQLQMMVRSILHWSHAILMSETVAQKLSHGDLAIGLFCANVLLRLHGDSPLMSLKPDEVSEMEWSDLFASLAACGPGKADRASGEASSQQLMGLKPYVVSEMEWSDLFASFAACGPGKEDRASDKASSRLLDTLCLTVQQNEKEIGKKVHHAVREYQNAFGRRISVI